MHPRLHPYHSHPQSLLLIVQQLGYPLNFLPSIVVCDVGVVDDLEVVFV